jgi:hypothetical protein
MQVFDVDPTHVSVGALHERKQNHHFFTNEDHFTGRCRYPATPVKIVHATQNFSVAMWLDRKF